MEMKTIITILVILLVGSVGYNLYQYDTIVFYEDLVVDWSDIVDDYGDMVDDYGVMVDDLLDSSKEWCEYSNGLTEIIKIYNPYTTIEFSECEW